MNNLDGFHVQIIHNIWGKGDIGVKKGWNWVIDIRLSEFFLHIVLIEEKASSSTYYDVQGFAQPRGSFWFHLGIFPFFRLCWPQ